MDCEGRADSESRSSNGWLGSHSRWWSRAALEVVKLSNQLLGYLIGWVYINKLVNSNTHIGIGNAKHNIHINMNMNNHMCMATLILLLLKIQCVSINIMNRIAAAAMLLVEGAPLVLLPPLLVCEGL